MKKRKYATDFLFSTSSFLIGAGSVLNLAGNYYSFNMSSDPHQADKLALSSDFGNVGEDWQSVLDSLDEEGF